MFGILKKESDSLNNFTASLTLNEYNKLRTCMFGGPKVEIVNKIKENKNRYIFFSNKKE